MTRETICAGCKESNYTDHPKEAACGLMRCYGFDGSESATIRMFVPFDAPGCVLEAPAPSSELAGRRQYVRDQKERIAREGK